MKRLSAVLVVLFIGGSFLLAADEGQESIFDIWEQQDIQSIELHLDVDALEANRKNADEIPVRVISNGVEMEASASVRGKFRRRVCSMPPIMLRFAKSELEAQGLSSHNDYKLVTHCTDGKAGQRALLREKLAYELYRTVNPEASFRTRLLNITYVNTVDGSTTTSYAIFIEDVDELKQRLGVKSCKECYNRPLESFENVETVTLFNYMIGNADFSTRMVRNLKLFRNQDGDLTVVPYDFDYCGLVAPAYAEGCEQRQLKWEFGEDPNLESAKETFLSYEDDFMAKIEEAEYLLPKCKKEVGKYVKGFFRELKSDRIGG